MMEELFCLIDDLIAMESLSWDRQHTRVRIKLARNGRSQSVHLNSRNQNYIFSSVVAKISELSEDRRSLAYRLWRRNALKPVVTFSMDRTNSVIGLIEQPICSVSSVEVRYYLETLARECDRLEYILTGVDVR